MKPIIEKLHYALITVTLEYLQKKGLDLTALAGKDDLGHGVDDFSVLKASLSSEVLISKIEALDAGELRKTLMLYLIKVAKHLETHEEVDDVLPILLNLHNLYTLNNHSSLIANLAGQDFELYGFYGWRSSGASILLQERIFTQIFGIPDNVSSLSGTVMKTIIQAKMEQELKPESLMTPVPAVDEVVEEVSAGAMEESKALSEMQKLLAGKDARIRDLQAKLSEMGHRLKEQQGRSQHLGEEVRRLEVDNKELRETLTGQGREISTLRDQVLISQEQCELQKDELVNLQKKLKDRDKPSTFTVSGLSRASGFGVSALTGASNTGMFSGQPSLFPDGARQRKPVTSPQGKK